MLRARDAGVDAQSVTYTGKVVCALTVKAALAFFEALPLGETDAVVADKVLREVRRRLGFLTDVGLDYLTLNRSAGSLSGGEAQRIRLATQVGSRLVGVLYVLDEPSIGLHELQTHSGHGRRHPFHIATQDRRQVGIDHRRIATGNKPNQRRHLV